MKMSELRKNELIDLFRIKELLFIDLGIKIEVSIPKIGDCFYWVDKDKLHIKKENKWVEDGFYYLRDLLL